MGKNVTLTHSQANDILDILNTVVELEDCFAEEVGKENCFHCQADKVAGYLFSGGLDLSLPEEDIFEPGC